MNLAFDSGLSYAQLISRFIGDIAEFVYTEAPNVPNLGKTAEHQQISTLNKKIFIDNTKV